MNVLLCLRAAVSEYENVEVERFEGLVVDYALKQISKSCHSGHKNDLGF